MTKLTFDYKLKDKFENHSKNSHGVIEKHGRMGFVVANSKEEAQKFLDEDAIKCGLKESIYELM